MFTFELFMEQCQFNLEFHEFLKNYLERRRTGIRRWRRRYDPAMERLLRDILVRQIPRSYYSSSTYNEFAWPGPEIPAIPYRRPEPMVTDPYLAPAVWPIEEPPAHFPYSYGSYGTGTNEVDVRRSSNYSTARDENLGQLDCTYDTNRTMLKNYQ
ncbi:hypothetical protein PPYR_05682, partial [Photinus pyralis]